MIAIAIAATTTLDVVYGMSTVSASAQSTSSNGMMGPSSSENMSSSSSMMSSMNNNNASSPNKNFYIFTIEIQGVSESKLGITGNQYSLQTMVVNKGDNVTVHFYNVEKNKNERHTFTIDAPYNISKDLAGGENATITFVADHEGIFQYHCLHHPPEMRGQLVVLPRTTATE